MHDVVVSYKNYKCRNCGHVQKIQTNHLGPCLDYCLECSWKPSFGKYAVPIFGRTYRPFDYAGKDEKISAKSVN